MRALRVMFVCMCLVGITQLVWNQDHGVDTGRGTRGQGIPGYLDPRTGTFTTKAQNSVASAKSDSGDPPSGTPILFRETFNFSISALGFPQFAVIFCYASISTTDPDGSYYESSSAVATRSGNSASCSVPLLSNWLLVNPTTDVISANYNVYAEYPIQVGQSTQLVERISEPPSVTLPMPTNTQTVTNNVSITM
jgi:hypothetical protein